MPLGDALGDPHDVPAFLLLQLDVGVEDAEVELVEEGQLVQLDLQGAHTGNTAQDHAHIELVANFLRVEVTFKVNGKTRIDGSLRVMTSALKHWRG